MKFEKHFGMTKGYAKEGFCGTSGLAPALLPILKRAGGHTEKPGKVLLGEPYARACLSRLGHLDASNTRRLATAHLLNRLKKVLLEFFHFRGHLQLLA